MVQFQSQEAGTHISTEWIIADCMAAVYGFQSKIKEEQKERKKESKCEGKKNIDEAVNIATQHRDGPRHMQVGCGRDDYR